MLLQVQYWDFAWSDRGNGPTPVALHRQAKWLRHRHHVEGSSERHPTALTNYTKLTTEMGALTVRIGFGDILYYI